MSEASIRHPDPKCAPHSERHNGALRPTGCAKGARIPETNSRTSRSTARTGTANGTTPSTSRSRSQAVPSEPIRRPQACPSRDSALPHPASYPPIARRLVAFWLHGEIDQGTTKPTRPTQHNAYHTSLDVSSEIPGIAPIRRNGPRRDWNGVRGIKNLTFTPVA